MGVVGLLGFTDNADIIGDIPHTAAIEPEFRIIQLNLIVVVAVQLGNIFMTFSNI